MLVICRLLLLALLIIATNVFLPLTRLWWLDFVVVLPPFIVGDLILTRWFGKT